MRVGSGELGWKSYSIDLKAGSNYFKYSCINIQNVNRYFEEKLCVEGYLEAKDKKTCDRLIAGFSQPRIQ